MTPPAQRLVCATRDRALFSSSGGGSSGGSINSGGSGGGSSSNRDDGGRALLAGGVWAELRSWARFLAPLGAFKAVYYPTPPAVARAMLRLARVGPGDTVFDLGCGDGRILVAAAEMGAAKCVGIEVRGGGGGGGGRARVPRAPRSLPPHRAHAPTSAPISLLSQKHTLARKRPTRYQLDADLVAAAHTNVAAAGLAPPRVSVVHGDAAAADLSGASVVALYLSARGNRDLLAAAGGALRPGARVVSHYFPVEGWGDRLAARDVSAGVELFLYRVPDAGAAQGAASSGGGAGSSSSEDSSSGVGGADKGSSGSRGGGDDGGAAGRVTKR